MCIADSANGAINAPPCAEWRRALTLPHRWPDLKIPKAENQAGRTVFLRIQRRHRAQGHTGRDGILHHLPVIDAGRQPQHQMHALVGRLQPCQMRRHVARERVDHARAPLRVHAAHAADVTIEVAFFDVRRQHVLVGCRWMAVHQDARANVGVHQRVRQYGIAEPQRRIKDLAERAQVDHAVRRQPLQRRKRMAGVTQLAVVVVFHDPRAMAFGPSQQRLAARHAKRHAEWILVRWRDKRRASVRGQRDARIDVDAFLVDRNADDALARSGAFQDGGNTAIGGIFHPHGIVATEQHLARQEQALLRAGGDHDLAGVALHRA